MRNMLIVALSLVGTLLSLSGLIAAEESYPGQRPNVLFILCDDLRWDALGYAGNRYVETPDIDRVARGGVAFKTCFARPRCARRVARASAKADSQSVFLPVHPWFVFPQIQR